MQLQRNMLRYLSKRYVTEFNCILDKVDLGHFKTIVITDF